MIHLNDTVQNHILKAPDQAALTEDSVRNHILCPCGNASTRMGAGKKPGQSSLHCARCKRFIRWIPASELTELLNKGGKIHIELPSGCSLRLDRCRGTLEYSSPRKGGER